MIRRLYVDNFRSLVDFTWEPGKECLVLGYNGSGKTSVLDALNILMNWVWGWDKFEDVLRRHDRTQWRVDEPITFECELLVGSIPFVFRASFEFSPAEGTPFIISEELAANGNSLFTRDGSNVSYMVADDEQRFPYPRGQSALKAVSSLVKMGPVVEFEEALYGIVLVRPVPSLMIDVAEGAPEDILPKMQNFIGWHYHNAISLAGFSEAVAESLQEVWEEFDGILFEKVGRESRVLKVVFENPPPLGRVEVDFRDLSDGEKMLLALYSLAAYQRRSPPTTIILDEPDNYVSLLEIQPWLLRMLNDRPDQGQIIIVSHNSEIVQTMGRWRVAYFNREDHLTPTKVSPLPPDETGLPLAELLARGWIDT